MLEADQVRKLKQVVDENAQLKRLVAELSLDKAVLQDVLSKKSSPASAHEGCCSLCRIIARLQRAPGLPGDAAAYGCTRSSRRGSDMAIAASM